MFTTQSLTIRDGYHHEGVPNTFFRQQGATDQATIVLPGRGYSCQGPVLSYPASELLTRNSDVLYVEYDRHPRFSSLSAEEMFRCCIVDAEAACNELFRQRTYRQITMIGKSLGTAVMGHLLTAYPSLPELKALWLTPLLRLEMLRTQIRKAARPSFFVIGTADPQYDPDLLAEVQEATEGEALVFNDANHSLLIEDDVLRSIQMMEQVIRALQKFLG